MAELPWISPRIVLREIAPSRQVGVRLRPPFPAHLAGVSLPLSPNRVAATGALRVLWLGPDEWLLIAPDGDAVSLAQSLGQALGGEPASIVEVSHRQVGITVSGPAGADAINCFNAIDLGESAFPVSMCTRTLFGKAEIVLWRTGRDAFRIEVWRSFAPYVMACLQEAISDPSIGAAATSIRSPMRAGWRTPRWRPERRSTRGLRCAALRGRSRGGQLTQGPPG